MIDQFADRFPITGPLVALMESTEGEASMTDPDPAYLAADVAFDADPTDGETDDELARALAAAAPFYRVQELDRQLDTLRARLRGINVFENPGAEVGIRIAIQELEIRRSELLA